jgi:hypothetical protein
MTMNINSLIPNDGSTNEDWTGQGTMAVLGMFGSPQIMGSDSITIRNVFIKDASIELNEGEYFVTNSDGYSIEMGLLVAFPASGKCHISNCIVQGEITFLCDDYSPYGVIFGIGGLIGDLYMGDNVVVDNCFANTKMNLKLSENNTNDAYPTTIIYGVGGFVGNFYASNPCEIHNCGAWLDMKIEATSPIDLHTGGFMGNADSPVDFYNCYARGNIEVGDGSYGLSGFANLIDADGRSNVNFNFYNCYVATTIDKGTTAAGYESSFSGWGLLDTVKNFNENCINSYYLKNWQEGNWDYYETAPKQYKNASPCVGSAGAEQPRDSMLTQNFVDMLNPTDTAFYLDGYGFLKNGGFPVLGLEPVTDPQVIDSGLIVEIPLGWNPDLTNDYYNPQKGIYLYEGGQFINHSTNHYVINSCRTLSGGGWEFIGNPLKNTDFAGTFGWLSNDTLFLNGAGSHVASGLNETFNGSTDMSEHWNTTHNYIAAYPFRYENNEWSNIHVYRTDSMKSGVGYMAWNGGKDYRLDKDGNFFKDEDNNPRPSPIPTNANPNPIGNQQNSTPPYNPAPTQLWFVGNVHKTDSAFTITLPANVGADKWYALANPYSCDLHIDKFLTANSSVLAESCVYLWDVSAQNWVTATDGVVPYGTGFMIKANSSPVTIIFNE